MCLQGGVQFTANPTELKITGGTSPPAQIKPEDRLFQGFFHFGEFEVLMMQYILSMYLSK
jgi:hypothetical protein